MRHFKIKRIFSALFVSYLLILVIPFMLVFFLTRYTSEQTENKYRQYIKTALEQSAGTFEENVNSMVADARYAGIDYSIRWLAYQESLKPADSRMSTMIECNKRYDSYFTKSAFYQDYAVIFRNGYAFRNTGMTVGREFFYEYYRNYGKDGYEEWRKSSFGSRKMNFLPMSDITVNGLKKRCITFNYPVPDLASIDSEAFAVIQLLISEKKLKETFSQLLETAGMSVYIIDDDGRCIACIGEAEDYSEYILKNAVDSSGSISINEDKDEFLGMYTKNEKSGYLYAACLPLSNIKSNMRSYRIYAALLLFGSLVVEILLGIRFSIIYTRPLKNMIKNISIFVAEESKENQDKLSKSKKIDEYEILEKGVSWLIDNNSAMESRIQENRGKINFLALLYHGEFQNNEEIKQEAENAGLEFSGGKYMVCIFDIGKNRDKVRSLIKEKGYEGIIAYNFPKEYILVLLVNAERFETDTIKSELERCTGDRVYAGMGCIYEDEVKIPFSYKQAEYCLKTAAENKSGKILQYSGNDKCAFLWYPQMIREKLSNAVKNGDEQSISTIFEQIKTENFKNRRLLPAMKKMLLYNIASDYTDICIESAVEMKQEVLSEFLERNADMESSLDGLKTGFAELGRSLLREKDSKEMDYKQLLSKYINENFSDSSMCLASIADHFRLSEGYFSQFFKNIMGDSFSNYLEKRRIAEAKQLIKEGKNDIESVSEKVGYTNSATFRRAFKRATGIAPTAYRQTIRDGEHGGDNESITPP